MHGVGTVLVVFRGTLPRFELQQVEHHDRALVGRVHERDELFLVGPDTTHAIFSSVRLRTTSMITRRARATLQPCAVRRRLHASHPVTTSSPSRASPLRLGNAPPSL